MLDNVVIGYARCEDDEAFYRISKGDILEVVADCPKTSDIYINNGQLVTVVNECNFTLAKTREELESKPVSPDPVDLLVELAPQVNCLRLRSALGLPEKCPDSHAECDTCKRAMIREAYTNDGES